MRKHRGRLVAPTPRPVGQADLLKDRRARKAYRGAAELHRRQMGRISLHAPPEISASSQPGGSNARAFTQLGRASAPSNASTGTLAQARTTAPRRKSKEESAGTNFGTSCSRG